MPLNFDWNVIKDKNDPRAKWVTALVVLGVLNLIAAYFVLNPPGGTASGLEDQIQQTQLQIGLQQAEVNRLQGLVKKVETARASQDKFIADYFTPEESASSTILTELTDAATKSALRPQAHTYQIEGVEGSDALSMMTITGNYEGSYGDLVRFINLLDRSPRFMMIDTIAAAPMQAQGQLSTRFKINTFLRGVRP
jgi:type IV pilus assembly protein PilO